ncbi:39896a76-b801-4937-b677-3fbcc4accf1f [Thermothielavioides terrestris]|nr:1b33ee83-3f06-4aee-aae4-9b061de62189 [Thermothielavioides terrestris]SPQ27048.1 39896a76-b801-4937-b677-3fbcc4accf1f [Thermothielavioides terrestris]
MCYQPADGHGEGACTNCYYSGLSTRCSLRLDKERKELIQRGKKELRDFKGFTPEYLQKSTTEELETFKKWIEDAEELQAERGSPKKRARQ